jgi:hypothetical protein
MRYLADIVESRGGFLLEPEGGSAPLTPHDRRWNAKSSCFRAEYLMTRAPATRRVTTGKTTPFKNHYGKICGERLLMAFRSSRSARMCG